jgi:hypothetical protein
MADVDNTLEFTATVSKTPVPALPKRLLQIRPRSGLRGNLAQPMYLIRSREVVLARRIRSALELRAIVGLPAHVSIGVLFFDRDEHLEQVWRRRDEITNSLATAGFDFVTSPSFSLYEPRARLEHLYNLRRSDVMTHLFATAGVPVIPRIDWVIRHDIIRASRWLRANPAVSAISLDWMTLKSRHSWSVAIDGLRLLDDLTEKRLHYLVNGPSNSARRSELMHAIDNRLTLTKSTFASPPPKGASKSPDDPYAWRAREAAELGLSDAA